MSKKFLLSTLLVTTMLFTACGSDDADTDVESTQGKNVYSAPEFQLLVPESWEIIEKGDFTSSVPSGTVVAFRNNVKNEIFTANISITQNDLEKGMSSVDLATSSLSKAKVSLVDYVKGEMKEFEVNKGEEKINGELVHFQGRKSASEPVVQFDQLYVVDGNTAFVLTAAYLATEDESVVKTAGEMLNSFALK